MPTDRAGRETGLRNPQGKPYTVCVMCNNRSMVSGFVRGVRTWKCESCGYNDDAHGPLN